MKKVLIKTALKKQASALLYLLLCSVLQPYASAYTPDWETPENTREYPRYIKKCQESTMTLLQRLKLTETPSNNLSTFGSCIKSFVSLQNPALLKESEHENLSDFINAHTAGTRREKCGLFCSSFIYGTGENFWLRRGDDTKDYYIEQIRAAKVFDKDDLDKLQKYHGGFEAVVDQGYAKGEGKSGLQSFGLVIIELATKLVDAEMQSLGLGKNGNDDGIDIDSLIEKYTESLRQCINSSTSTDQIKFCANQMKTYAASQIGHTALEYYINKFFITEVSADSKRDLFRQSFYEYNKCLLGYAFSPKTTGKFPKRIKSCAISAAMTAFNYTIQNRLEKEFRGHVDGPSAYIRTVFVRAQKTCKQSDLLFQEIKTREYYDKLQNQNTNQLEPLLKQCQEQIERIAAKVLAPELMRKEEMIKKYLNPEEAFDFSVFLVETYLDQCVEALSAAGKEASPKLCTNYLTSAGTFEFFSRLTLDKISEKLRKKGYSIENQALSDAIDNGTLSMNTCKKNTLQYTVFTAKRPDNDSKELSPADKALKDSVDKKILACLRIGIGGIGKELILLLIDQKISNNRLLKPYNIKLGGTFKGTLSDNFSTCITDNLGNTGTMADLLPAVENALNVCELGTIKEAMPKILDLVIPKVLKTFKSGKKRILTTRQADQILRDYKTNKNGLYKKISKARSTKKIDQLIDGAYGKLFDDLGPQVIRIHIKKTANGQFGRSAIDRYTKIAHSSLKTCLLNQKKPMDTCIDKATSKVLYRATDDLLIPAAKSLFQAEAKPYFSTRGLGLDSILKNGLSENGRRSKIVAIVKSAMNKKQSMSHLKKNKKIHRIVRQIFASSPLLVSKIKSRFMNKELLKAKRSAQAKELAKTKWHLFKLMTAAYKRKVISNLEARGLFNWKSLKQTAQGKTIDSQTTPIIKNLLLGTRGGPTAAEKARLSKMAEKGLLGLYRSAGGTPNQAKKRIRKKIKGKRKGKKKKSGSLLKRLFKGKQVGNRRKKKEPVNR